MGDGSVETDRITTFIQTGQNVQTPANRYKMTHNNAQLQYYTADVLSRTLDSLYRHRGRDRSLTTSFRG